MACTPDAVVCGWIEDLTGSQDAADTADWLVDAPSKIVLILVVGWVVSRLLKRAISQLGHRLEGAAEEMLRGSTGRLLSAEALAVRARSRTQTVTSVLRSLSTAVVFTFCLLLILGEVGLQLGPLVAGAGVAGVALGFGAQSMVRDFLNGLFVLIEDQYGVGDLVDLGEAVGTVEKVTLRATRVRDANGVVWHVPNGEVRRVANKSQNWSRALLDVTVAVDADVRRAMEVIGAAATALWEEPEWGEGALTEAPEVLGVQSIGVDGVVIRVTVTTEPARQIDVERELRLRIKEALDAAGVEMPNLPKVFATRAGGSGGAASAGAPG